MYGVVLGFAAILISLSLASIVTSQRLFAKCETQTNQYQSAPV